MLVQATRRPEVRFHGWSWSFEGCTVNGGPLITYAAIPIVTAIQGLRVRVKLGILG